MKYISGLAGDSLLKSPDHVFGCRIELILFKRPSEKQQIPLQDGEAVQTIAGHVLGFHGCEREVGEAIIAGEDIRLSENAYDWLGHGAYFWENSPSRALQWASDPRHNIKEPFVLGAVILMGNCLDLTDTGCLESIRIAFDALQEMAEVAGMPLPTNEQGYPGDGDKIKRALDCLVINFTHTYRRDEGLPPFDTVRAPWPEGDPLYPGACIRKLTHIQICVCDPKKSILGYFRPRV